MTGARARLLGVLALLAALLAAAPAFAHPAPFSYLDVHMDKDGIHGSLVVHVIDVAHDLGVSPADALLDLVALNARRQAVFALVDPRISLEAGHRLKLQWTGLEPLPEQLQLRLTFRVADAAPGALTVATDLFPYDRYHQTFVNLYDGGRLRQQWIFARGAAPRTYYAGTAAGAVEVMKTFIPAGIHHILIGPDHILFLIGLLLLGGSWKALVRIVTSFTLGHSITLSLATLGLVTPPSSLVEPAIALTIVAVGADNLMRGDGRDLRAWAALAFGLVHGFGFASVLREFGLPREALGWSLFSFNLGVEIGQLMIVVVAASLLDFLRKRSHKIGERVTVGGSVAVIGAGAYWFVQRVFFPGGDLMKRALILTSIVAMGLTVAGVVAAQRARPIIPPVGAIEKVKDNLYRIPGAGGNTTVFVTEGGVVLVDTKLANNGQAILDQVRKVTDKPVSMIINTHTHPDHNGSNDFFKAARPTIEVVAHANTAKWVAANPRSVPAMKPDRTFTDRTSLLQGKDRIDLYYFGAGHTNGDAFVVFPAVRAMDIGDLMAWKMAPLIDPATGGSVIALPDTLEKAEKGIKNVDIVIEGHGDVNTWQGMVEYAKFNRALLNEAKKALKAGKTPEDALAELQKNPEWAPFLKDELLHDLEYGGTPKSRALINLNVAFQELKGEKVTTNFGPPPPRPAGAAPQ